MKRLLISSPLGATQSSSPAPLRHRLLPLSPSSSSIECVGHEKIEPKAFVCVDVSTRWNSTYLMLDHALKFEKAFQCLEEEDEDFVHYFTEDENGKKRKGPPTLADWNHVRTFIKFLKMFYDLTLKDSRSKFNQDHKWVVQVYWSLFKNSMDCSF
ncbi:zinc finger BED domain-containing protein RICESLEEPER 4-like [Benincasa hispida]|uniref:zinc finger BED domain-containing protein RICESLEEPER 4-like n=1 Tax=Benincasa hispida TaxID=102211 RepID=UPI0019014F45|nr:zinc finger BED domain-containing protein RICESLEEPER 4-like [Benincasa hispida]